MLKFLRVIRGQRVDQPDFDHAVYVSQRDILARVLDAFGVGPTAQRSFVLEGFAVTTDGGDVVTVTGGRAVLGYRDRGVVGYGMLVDVTDDTKTIDLANYADSATARGVYIRAAFHDSDVAPRPFWSPFASPDPTETVRTVPTRVSESWDLAIDTTSPGEEWLQIASVVKNVAPVVVTDLRPFFFEGSDDASFDATDDWGTSADRNDNRETYGVFGLRTFVRAVQTVLSDITGEPNNKWWRALWGSASGSDGARSLTQLNDEKLSRTGSQTMTGNLLPDTDSSRSLGSTLVRWLAVWTDAITVTGTVTAANVETVDLDASGAADVDGNLTVGGTLEVAGNVDLAADLDVAGEVSTVTLAATGLSTFATSIQVDETASVGVLSVDSAAPSPVILPGRLYRNNIMQVYGRVTTDGAGDFSSTDVVGCTVTCDVDSILIEFDLPYDASTAYTITGCMETNNASGMMRVVARAADQCAIAFHNATPTDFAVGSNVCTISFMIIGLQA